MDPNNDVSLSTAKPFGLPVFADALKSPMLDEAEGLGPAARGTKELSLSEKGDEQTEPATNESIRSLIEDANVTLRQRHTALSFRIDDGTDSLVVQVVETESGDVIKQIPTDEVLAMRQRLQETIGVLLDTRG
ncbi:MAG: flagellar protein FlaG [Candidatus Zixiibacteriota bacterium]